MSEKGSAVLAAAASALIFLGLTGIITEPGRWYSPQPAYRQQTEALLSGRLALADEPFHHRHDAVWGHGLHQAWGLGVPLLRLPFELAGIGDRLVFLLYFALAAWLLLRALLPPPARALDAAFLLSATALAPALIAMARARFVAYEEAVAYGCLWSFGLLAALAGVLEKPKSGRYLALASAAGFSALIKPTYAVYGLAAFGLALWSVRRRLKPSVLLGGLFLFCSGPLLLLLTNAARFGDPLEFGQKLYLSGLAQTDLAMRFGHPYAREPLASAARELLGAMFFSRDAGWGWFYDPGLFPGQSASWRFRELYFSAFGPGTLLALVLAWAAAPRLRARSPLIGSLWGLGLACFLVLFVFYLRRPALSSRYFLDFLPAIAASLLALYLGVRARSPKLASGLAAAWLLLWAGDLAGTKVKPGYEAESRGLDAAGAAGMLEPRPAPPPEIADRYACPSPGPIDATVANGVGWDLRGSCRVDASTSFFVKTAGCIDLELETEPGFDESAVEARMGLERLQRADRRARGTRTVLSYCLPSRAKPKISRGGYQLVTIKWADVRASPPQPPPARLRSVSARLPP